MRQMKIVKLNLIRILRNFRTFLRWAIISAVAGVVIGGIGAAFAYLLRCATDFRTSHTWLILLLPLAGLLIVFVYGICNYRNDRGTNHVIAAIHGETDVPARMAPLIIFSTLVTHLFGGSAGREGAALQLGGSLGNTLGRIFRMSEKDCRVLVMCGMSAAFSAIFGTPIAAAVFAIEMANVGAMFYTALVPCAFSSLVASQVAVRMGVGPETYHVLDVPGFYLVPGLKIIFLALCCAGLSALFCIALHTAGKFFKTKFKNPYIRIVVSALVIIVLTVILQTSDYMGAGVAVIERAMEGHVVPLAFMWKIIFTALALGSGFKGGEIVPSFFIGATFGCLFGQLIGLSPSLCCAVGMVAVFCGVTNCPIASLLISFELFNYVGVPYFLLGISVSFLMSGYFSLYSDQTIVYSKYRPQFINRKAR